MYFWYSRRSSSRSLYCFRRYHKYIVCILVKRITFVLIQCDGGTFFPTHVFDELFMYLPSVVGIISDSQEKGVHQSHLFCTWLKHNSGPHNWPEGMSLKHLTYVLHPSIFSCGTYTSDPFVPLQIASVRKRCKYFVLPYECSLCSYS